MKIALYGGSFNPPHIGHIFAAIYIQSFFDYDQIWIVPCWSNPLKKDMLNFKYRLDMCQMNFSEIGKNIVVSSVERELQCQSTIDLVEKLQLKFPDDTFELFTGSDSIENFPKWKRWKDLESKIKINIIPRQKTENFIFSWYLPNISSSYIRSLIKNGNLDCVQHMLVPSVLDYIRAYGMYT